MLKILNDAQRNITLTMEIDLLNIKFQDMAKIMMKKQKNINPRR